MTTKFLRGRTYLDNHGNKHLVVKKQISDYGTHTVNVIYLQKNGQRDDVHQYRWDTKDGVEFISPKSFFKNEVYKFELKASDICDRYDSGERVEVYCLDEKHLPINKPYQAEPKSYWRLWTYRDEYGTYYIIDGKSYPAEAFVEF